MKKPFIILTQVLLTLIIIYSIFKTIDINQVTNIIKTSETHYVIISGLVFLIAHSFASIRISRTVEIFHYNLSYIKSALIHYFGILLSTITPGRAGYIGITIPMKRLKVPYKITAAYMTISQAIDLILKATFSIIGILILSNLFNMSQIISYTIYSASILGLFTISILIFFWKIELTKLIKFLSKYKGTKLATFLLNEIKVIQKHSKETKELIPLYTSTGILMWMILGFQWYLISLSLGLEIPYYVFLFLQPILTTLTFIPLTPAGFGIMEGASILILSLFGVPAPVALSLSLLIRITEIIPSLIGLKVIHD